MDYKQIAVIVSKSKVSLLGVHGYYTLVLTLFQENYGAELTLFLKTLLSVHRSGVCGAVVS